MLLRPQWQGILAVAAVVARPVVATAAVRCAEVMHSALWVAMEREE
jgi:hypothetical protein